MIKPPKNEMIWVQYMNDKDETIYVVTSDIHRTTYKLYKVENGKLEYTKHKSDNPIELEKWRR